MSAANESYAIASAADLFAVAYQIETDAVERYMLLADQMETHNNAELAAIFRDLARAEGIHAEEIRRQAVDIDVVEQARGRRLWRADSPEQADLGAMHYLMTPWHALQMALEGEKRALAFFEGIVTATQDPNIKQMAAKFAEEEIEHVDLCRRLLRKYPAPPDSWSHDQDPAISQ